MDDRHGNKLALLTRRVFTSEGALDPEVRGAIAVGREVPPDLAPYLEKVARCAYKVTDEDVQSLREAGYTEDQIFEATVCAALGAGLTRLRAGLVALEASDHAS